MTAYHGVLYILLYSSMHLLIATTTVCCFHLTSGTSTAVGPYIVHRNREGFLLSHSTLREECVEKKYQVFDTVGPLIILVQVNLSSPMERVQKTWSFGVSKPQHRCGVPGMPVVYKNDWSSAFLPGCACVHLPTNLVDGEMLCLGMVSTNLFRLFYTGEIQSLNCRTLEMATYFFFTRG